MLCTLREPGGAVLLVTTSSRSPAARCDRRNHGSRLRHLLAAWAAALGSWTLELAGGLGFELERLDGSHVVSNEVKQPQRTVELGH